MESIKQWVFSLALTMIACGTIKLILPKCGTEKMFKLTLNIFFLCAVISPVLFFKPELDININENLKTDAQRLADGLTYSVLDNSDAAIKDGLYKEVEDKLKEMGIKYTSIAIDINIQENMQKITANAEIILPTGYEKRKQKIQEELSDEFGFEINVL